MSRKSKDDINDGATCRDLYLTYIVGFLKGVGIEVFNLIGSKGLVTQVPHISRQPLPMLRFLMIFRRSKNYPQTNEYINEVMRHERLGKHI